MEKKNPQQPIMTSDLIKSVGCNLIILSITFVIFGILAMFGWILFELYFWGSESAWVAPLQDPSYLVGLAIVVFAIFFVLSTTWRNVTALYTKFSRYRTRRQEKARIDRLMMYEEAQDHQNAALLQYTENETYKESANGKR